MVGGGVVREPIGEEPCEPRSLFSGKGARTLKKFVESRAHCATLPDGVREGKAAARVLPGLFTGRSVHHLLRDAIDGPATTRDVVCEPGVELTRPRNASPHCGRSPRWGRAHHRTPGDDAESAADAGGTRGASLRRRFRPMRPEESDQ